MKTHLLLSLVLSSLSLTPAFSQNAQSPQITVTGSAEIKVVPDEIHMSVGVETRAAELSAAKSQHDEQMTSALKFLKTIGVPDKDVQTAFTSVSPEYGSDLSRTKPLVYIVRKSIEIKLNTVTNLESVLTGLLNNGVNQIHNVDFQTKQLRKYRDQARALAIRAAQEKADAMCRELGVKRGKPSGMTANEWGGGCVYGFNNLSRNYTQNADASPNDTDSTLSIGQISVSASVNVSYLIQ